ncbi:hypothetical protein FACS1894102_3560 [Spirochaetia bacterium]|nr:hypothetical protein FACS1894102_3560 [Spirochaetia bacterium]
MDMEIRCVRSAFKHHVTEKDYDALDEERNGFVNKGRRPQKIILEGSYENYKKVE